MSRRPGGTRLRPRRGPAQTGVALAVYLTVFIAMLDVSVVVLALPSIQTDLTASPGTVQWVIVASTLCLSVLSISAGALGDRYGRKRLFQLGLGSFTLGSALCATAATPTWLILARFIQGTGPAIVVPGSLSLIAQTFHDTAQRARIIAGWSTVAGAGVVPGGPHGARRAPRGRSASLEDRADHVVASNSCKSRRRVNSAERWLR